MTTDPPPTDPPPTEIVQTLTASGLIDGACGFAAMHGGRSNRVWRISGGSGDLVLKVYHKGSLNPLFANDQTREVTALSGLQGSGCVPRLRDSGRHATGAWVLYDHAEGSVWSTNPEMVAHLLYRVHQCRLPALPARGANGSVDLCRQALDILRLCDGPDATGLAQMIPENRVAPRPDRCLVHGDPVASNIIVKSGHAILIDWQCPTLGDPCEDLAVFLSPSMQSVYRGTPLHISEIDRFLAAYPDRQTVQRYHQLRAWFSFRAAAYCLWQLQRGSDIYRDGLGLESADLALYGSAT